MFFQKRSWILCFKGPSTDLAFTLVPFSLFGIYKKQPLEPYFRAKGRKGINTFYSSLHLGRVPRMYRDKIFMDFGSILTDVWPHLTHRHHNTQPTTHNTPSTTHNTTNHFLKTFAKRSARKQWIRRLFLERRVLNEHLRSRQAPKPQPDPHTLPGQSPK